MTVRFRSPAPLSPARSSFLARFFRSLCLDGRLKTPFVTRFARFSDLLSSRQEQARTDRAGGEAGCAISPPFRVSKGGRTSQRDGFSSTGRIGDLEALEYRSRSLR